MQIRLHLFLTPASVCDKSHHPSTLITSWTLFLSLSPVLPLFLSYVPVPVIRYCKASQLPPSFVPSCPFTALLLPVDCFNCFLLPIQQQPHPFFAPSSHYHSFTSLAASLSSLCFASFNCSPHAVPLLLLMRMLQPPSQ